MLKAPFIRFSGIIQRAMRPLATYENAIVALNALQSNASILDQLKKQREQHPEDNLNQVVKFLHRSGLQVTDLNSLNAIHVTGTKGKGSTCALTESILRRHGLKTGFYSSPHLIHVRERIRINGESLSEEKFAFYFWLVYNRLVAAQIRSQWFCAVFDQMFKEVLNQFFCKQTSDDISMPAYFKFLTIMAFHVFLAEKVDVTVVEVGIGGTYDCTNVIRKPIVCAITTIDFDHTRVLGDTLEQIAWQKSGIFKEDAVAVCADQPSTVLAVLAKRSRELKCPLFVVPSLETYHNGHLKVGIPGVQQFENASLALQLSRLWFQKMLDITFLPRWTNQKLVYDPASGDQLRLPIADPINVLPLEVEALETCKWPGRCQTIRKGQITFFLDGAHTPKSMELCSSWFRETAENEFATRNKSDIIKILIFNCTADRNSNTLLPYLLDCNFDGAIFCPGMVDTTPKLNSGKIQIILRIGLHFLKNEYSIKDLTKVTNTHSNAMAKAEENRRNWLKLRSKRVELSMVNEIYANQDGSPLESSDNCLIKTSPCISTALRSVECLIGDKNLNVAVLVTGSLHLVGAVLSVIDPDLKM